MNAATSAANAFDARLAAFAVDEDIAPGFRRVRSLGGIEEYRLLGNGLRVLFMEARAAPVALLMLTYDVGSRHEGAGFKGASHMLEHMMFKGSARFNKPQGTSIFDVLHPVGALTNATTWLDRTNYFDLVPTSHLELAMEIEADRMRYLRIAPADLEAERSVVFNEHDMYAGDPLERINVAVWREAFRHHPYGHPVLGTRDEILGLTREHLFDHYRRYYWPDNATLTVIGDVERGPTLELIRRHFEPLPAAGHGFEADHPAEPPQAAERRVVIEQAGQPGWVMLAYRMPHGPNPDADALELLGSVLTSGKLSRLYQPLIASGLASGAWSSTSRLKDPGLFQVQAMLGSGQDVARVERVLRDAIGDIARHGVSAQELERARGRARGQLLTSRDGPVAIALQLNEAIASGNWTSYATAIDRLAAVTPADVQRVAREYLIDAGLTVGHLVRPADEEAMS